MKSCLKYASVILLFLYLIVCPQQVAAGVRDGLVLWYSSVLPVLFPFMLLCGLVLKFDLASPLIRWLQGPLHAVTGCSRYGAFVIVAGFFCGFPMGAKLTADLRKQGKISAGEANFLYSFVNNLSPVFITSCIASGQMASPGWKCLFLINILGSALLFGLLLSLGNRKKSFSAPASRENFSGQRPDLAGRFREIDMAISDSIQNILRLGAYIVIFSVLGQALCRLADVKKPLAVLLVSCVEVSNGVRLISQSPLPLLTKYVLLSVTGAFGGLSAMMQTISIASMDMATIKLYIKSRVIITLLSAFISIGSVLFFGVSLIR